MESLYHQTNILLQEVTSQDLVKIERAINKQDVDNTETYAIHKMDIIYQNCNRLDILINKEPPSRRNNIKYRVDQLKYDLKHVQNSLAILQQRRCVREREREEREALLSRNFTRNDDTTIFLDHELHHHDKLGESNRALDDILGAGGSILEGLKHQGSSLRSAHTRVISLAQTLGLSNTVFRMIERRSTQDKYILVGGMVLVCVCLYVLLKYL